MAKTTPPAPPRARRTVGLDKPCEKCGRAIYFNYKGPVEGLCGRCADTRRRAYDPRGPGPAGRRSRSRRRRRISLMIVAAVVLGAVAAWFAAPQLRPLLRPLVDLLP